MKPASRHKPTCKERLAAVERFTRHLARRVAALDRKLTGLDQHVSGLLRDTRERLRCLERLLGE
jgi:hypothetical protein